MPVVVLDTETTGLGHIGKPQREDAIIQVGYAYRKADGTVERWAEVCNPGSEYFAGGRADIALRINNITMEQVQAARLDAEVAEELRRRLGDIAIETGEQVDLRAFNRNFDAPFLRKAPWGLVDGHLRAWGPCVMLAAQNHLDGPYGKWPKLEEAVRRLGIAWPEGPAHHAGVDSHAALLVHEAIEAAKRTPPPVDPYTRAGLEDHDETERLRDENRAAAGRTVV